MMWNPAHTVAGLYGDFRLIEEIIKPFKDIRIFRFFEQKRRPVNPNIAVFEITVVQRSRWGGTSFNGNP
jgi:hypothetical protein